jgi:PAS domain S-box-containing protein
MEQDCPDKKLHLENNELFHNMVENALDGINITQNGDFKYVNKAFCDMVGYTREELCRMKGTDLLADSDKERMMAQHFRRMQGAGNYGIDYTTLVHRNGTELDIEFNVTPIVYQGSNASFISIRDITERKKMQEKLEQSELKYRNLVENAHDGIIITQFGKFKFVNKAFCNMVEFSEEELLESNFLNVVADEDKERLKEYHSLRMAGEKHQMIYEAKGITKSGKSVYFEINTSYIDYNGHPATFIILRDHTAHQILEETLKASEKKYRTLIEKSLDGIIISQDSKIVMVNKAFADFLDFSVEECLEKFGPECVEPEDREWVARYHLDRMKGNLTDLTFTLRLIGKNGKRVITECSSTAIEIDGKPASLITSRDITSRIKMQEALEKSERKYRELADLLPQTIFELDLNGNVAYLNKAGRIAFGLSENDIGFPATTGIVPEDHERLMENIKKAFIEKGRDGGMEYTALRRDGKTFPIVIYSSPMTENNEIKGVRGLIVDISERKAMEESLRQSEKKYRELTEMLPQAVYELDAHGKPTYMNKAGLKAFGLDKGQKVDKAFDIFIPEDRQRMIKALEDEAARVVTDNCCPHSEPSEPIEYTAKRVDGTTFPVIIYGTSIVENCKVVGSRGMIVDISERKAMEESLRESEIRYRTLIHSLQEGLFVIQNGNFVFLNKAIVEIVGYTVEELTGQYFLNVIAPEYRSLVGQYHQMRVDGIPAPANYEVMLLKKDGITQVPVILSVTITDYQGEWALIGTAKDITDRIKAEEEIKAAHKRLEEINCDLEQTIRERTKELTKANTQLLKLQKENLQSQFDVLKQQVNPHFLFNSLNVLTSLIRLEPELAEKFTEHLAKVYRYVLENKDNELVNLSTEISFLDAYIFLIKIRFMDKVVVNIGIPDEKKNFRIIPLAMQLLIENAIKHNSMSKKSPLVIDIFIDEPNYLNVVNNLQEREAHMTSTGVGLKNIQNRYKLLNNTIPVFEKTETHFAARIPLVGE